LRTRIIVKGILILLAIQIAIGCNIERRQIKKLTTQLAPITNELESNPNYHSGGAYLQEMNNKFPDIINKLINKHDLCAIDKYEDKGIAFVFSCEINKKGKRVYETDPQYNLIKITKESSKDQFLHYEQFADHGAKPIELENDWYYIEQQIYFD